MVEFITPEELYRRKAEQKAWLKQQKKDEKAAKPPKKPKRRGIYRLHVGPVRLLTPEEKLAKHAKKYKAYKERTRIGKEKAKMRKAGLHITVKRPKIPLFETGLPKKKRQGKKLSHKAPIRIF